MAITVALEFHPGTLTHTAASTVRLIEDIDLPNLRTHWQPDPQLSANQALEELRTVLPYLAHLHVFTWGAAGIADRRPLAAGSDLWPAALALAETSPLPDGATRYALCEYVRGDSPRQLRGRSSAPEVDRGAARVIRARSRARRQPPPSAAAGDPGGGASGATQQIADQMNAAWFRMLSLLTTTLPRQSTSPSCHLTLIR